MSEALNEIHAYFGKLNTTTTAPVKQWAYGQKLVIHDADLPNVFEAYYSNSRSKGEASPQIGTDGVVDAPHAYFRSGADIYVFLMVHEGQDDGRYNKIVHIPIDPCSQPVDVEPAPQEQSVIDQTIAALNEAVEQSESNVEHYPRIIDGYWHVWDTEEEDFVSTGVEAQGETGATPDFTIGTVQTLPAGSQATASITGTDEEPVLSLGIPQGIQGIQGVQGEKGDKGEQGDDYVLTTADKEEIAETVAQSEEVQETIDKAVTVHPLTADYAPIVTITDGADGIPMDACTAKIEPVQSGEGDPSPENIRPITGWTGCNVVVSPTEDAQDGTTYPISWQTEAGTVYGGTVDLVSGVLMVDRVATTINDLTWTWNSTRGVFYAIVSDKDNVAGSPVMCDRLPYKGTADSVVHAVQAIGESGIASSINTSQPYIYLIHGNLDSQASLKAALGTAQIVYQLATPQTYQLTPVEVKTILGLNNVWADTGDVEVQYRADTKLYIDTHQPDVPVEDVQINGMSIVTDGVANVPIASEQSVGVVRSGATYGVGVFENGVLYARLAGSTLMKGGTDTYRPIVSAGLYSGAFYGLAKAAGADMKDIANTTVGVYPEAQKSAISMMLNAPVEVTGTTPTIAAKSGIQYICGEVATLDITLPDSGIVDVVFTSGSTPTVLTVTPPTGQTVRWANGFDATALEADTVYEINILNGLGVTQAWSTS